jgi:hypothetical protein
MVIAFKNALLLWPGGDSTSVSVLGRITPETFCNTVRIRVADVCSLDGNSFFAISHGIRSGSATNLATAAGTEGVVAFACTKWMVNAKLLTRQTNQENRIQGFV